MERRKLLDIILALAILAATVIGCGNSANATVPATTTPAAAVKNVNVAQAQELIQANQSNTGFIILDVRTPEEYAAGHIANAMNIDYSAPNFSDEVNRLDKTNTYLVYCHTGARSAAASQVMQGLGFKDIYNMTGGITDWQAAGYPVVK
jgi:rhodanese-related sulfurtransferase